MKSGRRKHVIFKRVSKELSDIGGIYISGNTELRGEYPNVGGCAAAEASALHVAAGDLNLVAIMQADVVDLVLIFRCGCGSDCQVSALNSADCSPAVVSSGAAGDVFKGRELKNFRWKFTLVLTIIELILGPIFIFAPTIDINGYIVMGALTSIAGTIEVISAFTMDNIKNTIQDGKDIARIVKYREE